MLNLFTLAYLILLCYGRGRRGEENQFYFARLFLENRYISNPAMLNSVWFGAPCFDSRLSVWHSVEEFSPKMLKAWVKEKTISEVKRFCFPNIFGTTYFFLGKKSYTQIKLNCILKHKTKITNLRTDNF